MKSVNLIPSESRRDRSSVTVGTVGPAHFVVLLLAIAVILVLLRVLTDNTINNRKATLAATQVQVTAAQAEASKLSVYVQFVNAAEQREASVRAIADGRFPWKETFDELSRVMPASTTLTNLSASTTGGTNAAGASVPTFTLAGCADTRNQDGTATLIRRLRQLIGVTTVSFQSSTRAAHCGNSFNLSISFKPLPGAPTTATPTATPASTSTTTTTATDTTTTGTTG